MFAYTFGALKKHPTIDFLDNGRIKHYLTCYVYKRSGLLSRERVIEKNQFQIAISNPTIEVDSVFPDRFLSYLQSKPYGSNSPSYEFRARCNTHLMPGLPFLVEFDMATTPEISSVQLSLHQVTRVSIGADEEDLGSPTSRYVHEVTWPPVRQEGHFRQKDSSRTAAHGRPSWLLEWICPAEDARVTLPFEDTIYCITEEGALHRGLSLKIEVELRNTPTKLAAVVHNIEYRKKWTDSRRDQTIPLRHERSIFRGSSPAASIRPESRQGRPTDGRRNSSVSSRSATTQQSGSVSHLSSGQHHPHHNHHGGAGAYILGSRQSPLTSPSYLSPRINNDYFGSSYAASQRPQTAPSGGGSNSPRLVHGSYSPGAVQLFARTDSVRSNTSSHTAYSQRGPHESDKITLPPAAVRASLSSAFEAMNMRHSTSSNPNSPTRRNFDQVPRVFEEPAPPPKLPLPAAPVRQPSAPSFPLTLPTLRDAYSPIAPAVAPPSSPRMKKPTRLSRPAVILGISQDTVQTRESFDTNKHSNEQGGFDEYPHMMDRDSGFSETSSFAQGPGSPLNSRPAGVVNTTGYALRRNHSGPTGGQDAPSVPALDDGGVVMLG